MADSILVCELAGDAKYDKMLLGQHYRLNSREFPLRGFRGGKSALFIKDKTQRQENVKREGQQQTPKSKRCNALDWG